MRLGNCFGAFALIDDAVDVHLLLRGGEEGQGGSEHCE